MIASKESPNLLSVVVPAFDEEMLILSTLQKIHEHLAKKDYAYEILVVDDGSRDRTARWAERWFLQNSSPLGRVLRLGSNRGKGCAVRSGMLAARGDFRLFMDADSSTGIEEIDKFWDYFAAGSDIVIGSRALGDSVVTRRQTSLRYAAGMVFRPLRRALVIGGIKDTQCGFKCFRANAAEEIFTRAQADGFVFDVEALFIARRLGFSVAEVPVVWTNDPDSKLNTLRDSLKMFWGLLEIRRRGRRGIYNGERQE
ncbi:MAG TPA: dolichyl-phosphate beta-glucosyltransferase [Myxococcota bacterium]|nr:dolichyl-phosphate beta-glucosyltransferase [Myxococcota bacterium]